MYGIMNFATLVHMFLYFASGNILEDILYDMESRIKYVCMS